MKEFTIRMETEADYRAVEDLTREAFWNVYQPGCNEHYFVHKMRQHADFLPELAFVLEADGKIVGSILYTKSWLEGEDGKKKEILTFGPVCVHPEYQRMGGSRKLIEHSFAKARDLGYEAVVIFGSPANYVGRGFLSCKKKNVFVGENYYPTAMLVKELVPGVLDGKKWRFIGSNADACCEDTEAVAAFDATFPPKEKAWKPSQEEFYIYSHSSLGD